jgi:DNA-binding NarL/FixJ family response regulator
MLGILVADDHEVMRQGVTGLLQGERDWRVCAEARDGREAVALAARDAPDIAILDVTMPELDGLEATKQIVKVSPTTKVLIFTVCESPQFAREVLDAGARGYVLKTDAASELVSAVASLTRGMQYVSARLLRSGGGCLPSRCHGPAHVPTLTPREREIAQLLAEGKTNWCVATMLGISVKTVETHRGNIMHKLGLESIVELVHYALRHRLVSL